MKTQRLLAVSTLLFILGVMSALSQSGAVSICQLAKYSGTIACLPTEVANNGAYSEVTDALGNVITQGYTLPLTVPFGLGAQYASQIATSPSAATSAGYVFTFEKGALSAKPADLGPLLSDLPQTIGRNRLYIGTSYQWMEFSKTGGQSLNSFKYLEGAADFYYTFATSISASASLKTHSIDTYISYGVTDRLDIAAVIPWSQTEMSVTTSCPTGEDDTYQLNGTGPFYCLAQTATNYPTTPTIYDTFFFEPQNMKRTASGLDDVTLRGKYEILKKEHQGLALGVEVRLPTGNPLNMQGSGATGVRPFLAWGYNGRVSPHVNIGVQYNGSSVDDVRDNNPTYCPTGTSIECYTDTLTASKLPNIFTSSFGADFAVTNRINLNADLLIRAFSNDGSAVWNYTANGLQYNTANFNSGTPLFAGAREKTTFVIGEKAKLPAHLLFSANLMVDAGNNGMSYKPSPIATLSYDFGFNSKSK